MLSIRYRVHFDRQCTTLALLDDLVETLDEISAPDEPCSDYVPGELELDEASFKTAPAFTAGDSTFDFAAARAGWALHEAWRELSERVADVEPDSFTVTVEQEVK